MAHEVRLELGAVSVRLVLRGCRARLVLSGRVGLTVWMAGRVLSVPRVLLVLRVLPASRA